MKFSFQLADVTVRYRTHEVEFPRGRCPECRADLEQVGFIEWSLDENGLESSVVTNRLGEKELVVDGEEVAHPPDPEVHTIKIACGRCRSTLVSGELSVDGFKRTNLVEMGLQRELRAARVVGDDDS
jgi:hypothetical protein